MSLQFSLPIKESGMKFSLNTSLLLGIAMIPQLSMAGMFAKPYLFLFENNGVKVEQLEASTDYQQDYVRRILTGDPMNDKFDYLEGEGGHYPAYQFCAADMKVCEPVLEPDEDLGDEESLTSSVSSSSSSDDLAGFTIRDRTVINELLELEDNQKKEGKHLRKAMARYSHNFHIGTRYHIKRACFYAERSKNNIDKAVRVAVANNSLTDSGYFGLFMASDVLEKHRLMLCDYDKSVYLYEYVARGSENLEPAQELISNYEASMTTIQSKALNKDGFASELTVISARDNVQSLGGMLSDLQSSRKACEIYGKGDHMLEVALMEDSAAETVERCSETYEVREYPCARVRTLQYATCMQVKSLYKDALALELKNRRLMSENKEYISSRNINDLKVSLLDIRNLAGCN